MIDLILQLVCTLASFVVLWRTEPALNRMSCCTHLVLRLAVHLLCVGAVAQIGVVVLFSYVPTVPEVLTTLGLALLLTCERRLRVLVPPPRPGTPQRDAP